MSFFILDGTLFYHRQNVDVLIRLRDNGYDTPKCWTWEVVPPNEAQVISKRRDGAFMVFSRKDVMHMVGERAGGRIRSISALWVSMKGRNFRRTAYRHKLLRHEVVVYEPEHDWIPPLQETAGGQLRGRAL